MTTGEDYTIDGSARIERVVRNEQTQYHAIVHGKRIAIERDRMAARAAVERLTRADVDLSLSELLQRKPRR